VEAVLLWPVVVATLAAPAWALDVPVVPLVTNASTQTPLNLLVLGKDHKLFYEAYDDASDLDGDGLVDTRYKPASIDYYGYFDSKKCYVYSSGRFDPVQTTSNKQCNSGSNTEQWSGDFLNYLTTARIDALRRVLYGGSRYLDEAVSGKLSSGRVVLQRAYIPQDAHAWGKQYTSIAVDGYDLSRYAPAAWQPASGERTLFANVTIGTETDAPLLRVVKVPSSVSIWNWLSKERPVAGNSYNAGNGDVSISPSNLNVRVRVCDASFPEDNCKKYSDGSLRPSGLLQKYGDSNRMRFGLLSGSFDRPLDGGVLRKNIGDISDEISTTSGQFLSDSNGIISTLNKLRVVGFKNSDWTYGCGWELSNDLGNIGNCRNWGNPLAEMMYEALRYYAGLGKTSAFNSATSVDSGMGLPVDVNWQNPYGLDGSNKPRNYWCAKPNITLISDAYTSYDTGLPGSPFDEEGRASLGSFSMLSAGNTLWNWEFADGSTRSRNIAIGELSTTKTNDLAPTLKAASSFATIRGQTPGEPTRQGGFGTSLLAYYARSNTLVNPASSNKPGDSSLLPKINTYAVSLSSPSLKVSIPLAGKQVTIQPFAKSVGGSGVPKNGYYPTDQIVDYYVTQVANTAPSNYDASVNGGRPYYKFSINYEDVEQGADHDMDAIAEYTIAVTSAGKVSVAVDSTYAAGGIDQHMGYIITGVKPVKNGRSDGLYLVVKDVGGGAVNYALDYRDTGNNSCKATANDLPLKCTLEFEVDTSASAVTTLNDPLWYAAKYGGYADSTLANSPSAFNQIWDNDGDGVPDNYFLVVNPLRLEAQLAAAFDSIARRAGSLTSGSATSLKVMADSLYFETTFDSANWTGELSAYKVNLSSGVVDTGTTSTLQWSAGGKLTSEKVAGADRKIIAGSNSGGIPFRAANLQTAGVLSSLRETSESNDTNAQKRVDYLRGSSSNEGTGSGQYRARTQTKLGDLLRSAPLYVGAPYYQVEQSSDYDTFRSNNLTRTPMVYVGGNDGMLHGFKAATGEEAFSFIPKVFLKAGERSKLVDVVRQGYAATHQNFVNGQQTRAEAKVGTQWRTLLAGALGEGGRELYLLDITQPASVSESNAANLVKWEFTNNDDSDLGLTFGRPYIAKLNDGNWYVLAPNGYYDKSSFPAADSAATRKSGLFILPVNKSGAWVNQPGNASGSSYFKLMTSVVGENGLSELRPVDLNKDGKVDMVYAGDLRGNVWKFDLSSATPAQWSVASQPLFTATGPDGYIQPIVVAPAVAYNTERRVDNPSVSQPGLMVYVGTGKFIEQCDKSAGECGKNDLVRKRESATNSVYGIWDYGGSVCGRHELRAQTIGQYTATGGTVYRTLTRHAVVFPPSHIIATSCSNNGSPRTFVTDKLLGGTQYPFTATPPSSDYRLGWYQDLPVSGERVITDLTQTAKQLQYLTYVPDVSVNGCATQAAEGYLMAVNTQTGGAFSDTSIVITDQVDDANKSKLAYTAGVKVNAAFGYNLFDAPKGSSFYSMQDKPYQPFLVGKNNEGCANNVKTSAGQTVRLNAGASCARTVQRVSWREVMED
jgi:type IV pilus assembly protein PilY1